VRDTEFIRIDAGKLASLDRQFDSVIDCGLFHVLSDANRRAYVAALAHVTKLRGKLFLMCFSDQEPAGPGPRRIRQDEIRAAFAEGWIVESIRRAHFEPNPQSKETFVDGGPRAWFSGAPLCAPRTNANFCGRVSFLIAASRRSAKLWLRCGSW